MPTGDNSITFDIGFTHLLGSRCTCGRTEAACAWWDGCCDACIHWTRYDAAGNGLSGQQREHGSEKGFQQHRYRREPPCLRCTQAHRERSRIWKRAS